DTRSWQGDIRVGGAWETTGVGRTGPYRMIGEFIEVAAPARLVHSWAVVGAPGGRSTVSYDLESPATGTRLTLRHAGLDLPPVCEAT
ncbi:SRPBCC domain-containing protein, partial [Acinetobacter baumannii]